MRNVLALLITMVLFSCSDEIIPSGKLIKEIRFTSEYSSIIVSNGISLSLHQDDNNELIIEADDNIIQYVETYINDGILYIEIEDGIDIKSEDGIKTVNINAFIKLLKSIDAYGGSTIKLASPFKLSDLNICASGGSVIEGDLFTDNLYCNLSGGSDISLYGNCNKLHIVSSGGSKYHFYGFIVNDINVDASGGSMLELYADGSLSVVNASGGSRIFYKGDASVSELNLSGGSTILKQ